MIKAAKRALSKSSRRNKAAGKPLYSSGISTYSQSPAFPRYVIIRHDSAWHPLPVSEVCTKGGEWNPAATPHPRPARHARFFSPSMRCRNGSDVNPTNGFSMAIGLSQGRLTSHSIVGPISTTSRSTSILTSSRPSSSCSASGISSSTLPADTPGSLAPTLLLSPSSC